jgi:hypothetical protein
LGIGEFYAMHQPNSVEDILEKGYVRRVGSSLSCPTSAMLRNSSIHNDRDGQTGKMQNRIGKYMKT